MDFQHVVICCDVWSIHLCLIFSSWSWGMEAGTGWSPWNSWRKRLGSHGPQCSCEVGNSWDSFQWFPQPVFLTFIIIYIHAQSIPVHHVHFATFDHRKQGKPDWARWAGEHLKTDNEIRGLFGGRWSFLRLWNRLMRDEREANRPSMKWDKACKSFWRPSFQMTTLRIYDSSFIIERISWCVWKRWHALESSSQVYR